MNGQPFDRTASLYAWRESLLNRGGVTTDDADELQSHLEEVESELLTHLAPEEAFWVAAHRLGTPEALTREFGKVKPNTGWLLRGQWMLIGVLIFWVFLPVANAAVRLLAAAFASVPALAGLAAFLLLNVTMLSFVQLALATYLVIRRWGGRPESVESLFTAHGLRRRWVLVFSAAAFALLQVGIFALMTPVNEYLTGVLNVPGEPAPLQSFYWPALAAGISYLLPGIAILLVMRLQKQRSRLP